MQGVLEENGNDRLGAIENRIVDLSETFSLTEKEKKICQHLVFGHSAKKIALKEGLTYETVRWYRKIIYQKIGVKKQTELMSLFML